MATRSPSCTRSPSRTCGVVALSVIALAVLAGCGEARPRTEPSIGQADGDFALSPRVLPAQAWTGEQLFVFGGNVPRTIATPFNDGALVDPETDRGEPLAPAPFEPTLGYPKAIAADGRVFVIGYSCAVPANVHPEIDDLPCDPGTYDAATYEIAKDRWHRVEIPPELREFTSVGPFGATIEALGATSDGRAVLTLGDYFAPQYWTVELASGNWAHLDEPPVQAYSACVSNDELVLLTTKYKNGDALLDRDPHVDRPAPGQVHTGYPGDGHVLPSLAILDLNGNAPWRQTPPAEGVHVGESPPNLSCLDDVAAVIDSIFGPGNMLLYTEATATWSTPPPPPPRAFLVPRIWTGRDLIFLPTGADVGAPGLAYTVAENCWRVLEGAPVARETIWSGSAIVGYAEPGRTGSGPTTEPGPYHYVLPEAPCVRTTASESAAPPASAAQAVRAAPLLTE